MPKLATLEEWQQRMALYFDSIDQPTGMPHHRMGVHQIGQPRPGDWTYIGALRPPAIKLVDPDPEVVRRCLGLVHPNGGVVVLRDHPLSEQKQDMYRQPFDTGRRHAIEWVDKLTRGRFKEFNGDPRIVVCGINEPDVHNAEEEKRVLEYTKVFLETLTGYGIRALALNLSVGWPRNTGAGVPPTWETFLPLEPIILAGKHFLCVHEYWYPTPQDRWGWYANRISACPMSVPTIIGECGYTRQLIRMDIPQPWGWVGNMSPADYAEQLWYYHDRVDPNVFAIMPFTTNFGGSEWASKDTAAAHGEILKRIRAYSFPTPWPVKKVPPTDGGTMDIIAPVYQGKVSGYYGSLYVNAAGANYGHEGLDISMPEGTPLYAPFDGIVAWSDNEAGTYGNYIRISGALKADFFYGHLKERLVQTGNSVKKGQLIGYSGNTGNSTGPHLHFEVRLKTPAGQYQSGVSAKANARVDPLAWLAGFVAAGGTVEFK